MYPNMFNRDELFFRLGNEKSEDVLNLIRNIENPNFQDDKGISYLHRACQAHYVDAIKLLLELGADPNITDKRGFSPILEALGRINENNNEIFIIMLKHGLDLNRIEGNMSLREQIAMFNDKDLNATIEKYFKHRGN